MSEPHINNAVINSVRIGFDRDCFLCVWVFVDHAGGGTQGFGGYVLGGTPDCKAGDHANQRNLCADFIVGCLRAGDVETFDKLVGKAVRVMREDASWGASIIGIGHIIKDDRWYNARDRMKELSTEGGAA